ncbi:MAG: hypothetical protein ABIH00_03865 [Armatimonadota bacterium]
MKIHVFDSFSRAFKHTAGILFKPFRLSKWLKLGFISLFICGGGFSFNFNIPVNWNQDKDKLYYNPAGSCDDMHWGTIKTQVANILNDPDKLAVLIGLAVIGILVILALTLLFIWLKSVMNFVFLDNIIKNCAFIKEPFHRLKSKGGSLFLWLLGFGSIVLFFVFILASVIILNIHFYSQSHNSQNMLWILLYSIILLFVMLFMAIIGIITMDFILPVMYAEDIKILAAWKKFMSRTKGNILNFVIYLFLKLIISICQGIISIFALLICFIVLGIPVLLIVLFSGLLAVAFKLTWNAFTIFLTVFFGGIAFAVFVYLMYVLLMPIEVYRRIFAMDVLGQIEEKWNLLKVSYPDYAPKPKPEPEPEN